MSDTEIQLSSWGLADELLQDDEQSVVFRKYLMGRVGNEFVAVADANIREVVDRPKVTPWLKSTEIVGVFALRGDIYTLTDPLKQGLVRRIAVVLELDGRFLAVGLDEMNGVETVAEDDWRDFESNVLGWARRIWDNQKQPYLELNPAMYVESFDARSKEPSS